MISTRPKYEISKLVKYKFENGVFNFKIEEK